VAELSETKHILGRAAILREQILGEESGQDSKQELSWLA
jgi:hypothetical protein